MKIKILSFCLFAVLTGTTVFAGDSINVPEKVSQIFRNSFPQVGNVKWHRIDNCYEAYFRKSDNSVCKAFYSKCGKLLYTFKYSSGEDLPMFIKTILAEKYRDRKIVNATEVYANNSTNYYIILEDRETLNKVRITEDGTILQNESFVNAD